MKKINILVIPTVIGVILLSGCTGTNTVDGTTTMPSNSLSPTPTIETPVQETIILNPFVNKTNNRISGGNISIEVPEFVNPAFQDELTSTDDISSLASFRSPIYNILIFDKAIEDPTINKSNWKSKLSDKLVEKEDNNGRIYLINQFEETFTDAITEVDYIQQFTSTYFWVDEKLIEVNITFYGLPADTLGLSEAETIAISVESAKN